MTILYEFLEYHAEYSNQSENNKNNEIVTFHTVIKTIENRNVVLILQRAKLNYSFLPKQAPVFIRLSNPVTHSRHPITTAL